MSNLAHDLFLLTTNLSQHKEKQNIISLFTQGMQSLFPGFTFNWLDKRPSSDRFVVEVQTRNKIFGYILIEPDQGITQEARVLIQNAAQMLAIILERIEHEEELEVYRTDLEMLVDQKTHDIVVGEIKYRLLFESMIQGVVYQDAEGKITAANPTAERILGLTLDQMQGRTSTDPRWHAVHEDGSPFPGEEHPSMIALKTGKEVKNVLMGIFNPSLEDYTWINIHAVPHFKLGEDKPYEVFTTFEDVTIRKQNYERLKKSEALYHDLVETSQDLIWQCDEEGRYIYLNPAWEDVFGYKVDEMLGKQFTDFQTNESAKKDMVEFERLMKGNIVKGLESVHLAKDGREIHLVFNAKFVHDETGKVVGTRGTAFDITLRKQQMDKLASISKRQKAILGAVPDIIMEVDVEKVYSWTNQAGLEFFGEDVIGMPADHYFEGEQDTYQQVKPLFNGYEDVVYVESWQRRKDGEVRLLAWWCRVLKNEDGEVTGALSTARDITEQYRLQEDLQKKINRLELMNEQMVDRELRMVELKEEIKRLKEEGRRT